MSRKFLSSRVRSGGALLVLAVSLLTILPAQAQQECPQTLRYTFSWSLETDCNFMPRGGTSQGPGVTLDPTPHPGWLSLQEAELSDHERDRRAILAMAGPYRASFEFLETVGYTPDFSRTAPYRSWGTEYIYVVEERPDFISLQHIIVMFVEADDGEVMGPFVQKHWRQDWQYEKPEILSYTGNNTWKVQALEPSEYRGTWAQSVFQVDDSPRYESYGKWQHYPNFSTWISADTWRPLPRRESSVRDDYQVLEGRNRHTIVSNGWVHEEENYKVRLDADGGRTGSLPYVAKELGVNRYERIVDFDFSAGDEYWRDTSVYWQDVRAVWDEFIHSGQLILKPSVDGVPLFAALFELAESAVAEPGDADYTRQIREVLQTYIQ